MVSLYNYSGWRQGSDMEKTFLSTVRKIHALFRQSGYTLSVAESCTGGLISHLITTLPGASSFFEAGVVSYSISAKRSILDVSLNSIEKYGVISAETALEMAEKIRQITGTDYSLSTTGNLGPDVLEGKARGLIYIAVSNERETAVKELRLKGARAKNKEESALLALQFLLEIAEKQGKQQRKTF